MTMSIPRGIVYHDLADDILALIQSSYCQLDDESLVKQFEREFAKYIECDHCVAFPYARTAIYYALKSKKFDHNCEVIMPPITIKGILDVVLDLGLKPVFVDIDPETLCFNLDQLAAAINKQTKAVLITYLFGMVPDIDKMISIAREKGLFIIEDFSQCLNGTYNGKKIGGFGDAGIYSSSSIKTLDTYGGGLLVCNNTELAEDLRGFQAALAKPSRKQLIGRIITDLIRNVATTRLVFQIFVFPLIKLMNRLKPDSMIKHTGERDKEQIKSLPKEWFTSYTSFQAKIGLSQIRKVATGDNARISNCELLKSLTPGTRFPKGVAGSQNVYWQLVAYFDNPAETRNLFFSRKVDTATTSLEKISNLPAYSHHAATPNADRLYSNGLFIPCYPGLSREDLEHVAGTVNEECQRTT